ncbi:Oxygen-dependent coproporphyrinogen-III oxidase, chloroplastic [Ananas comosus]|uniref:Oxygen-dependent coproporphyrinogen-III oxidase, chloroplastic n=1 Tax=Ananas comosus TaxID=4615 RepID=A0A199VQ18_ANACO|nr:Oxygen-dependent coproporphyrinogen-III oxidase, chloroplastic [Ananas comosus]
MADLATATSVHPRFERMIREALDEMCAALKAVDGGAAFKEDVIYPLQRAGAFTSTSGICSFTPMTEPKRSAHFAKRGNFASSMSLILDIFSIIFTQPRKLPKVMSR